MPLEPGSSKEVISKNIREFHGGQTYQNTKRKFGKATADKQAVAASFSEARRSSKASPSKSSKGKSNKGRFGTV